MVRPSPLLSLALATGLFFTAALMAPAVTASVRLAQNTEATPAPAPGTRALTEKEKKAAIEAIEGQLKAFKANNWEAATKFQHSSLRKAFSTPAEFRDAITRGYPQFAKYKTATFGDSRCSTDGNRVEIRVLVTGVDGILVKSTYVLLWEENQYRVAGVAADTGRERERQDVA